MQQLPIDVLYIILRAIPRAVELSPFARTCRQYNRIVEHIHEENARTLSHEHCIWGFITQHAIIYDKSKYTFVCNYFDLQITAVLDIFGISLLTNDAISSTITFVRAILLAPFAHEHSQVDKTVYKWRPSPRDIKYRRYILITLRGYELPLLVHKGKLIVDAYILYNIKAVRIIAQFIEKYINIIYTFFT